MKTIEEKYREKKKKLIEEIENLDYDHKYIRGEYEQLQRECIATMKKLNMDYNYSDINNIKKLYEKIDYKYIMLKKQLNNELNELEEDYKKEKSK